MEATVADGSGPPRAAGPGGTVPEPTVPEPTVPEPTVPEPTVPEPTVLELTVSGPAHGGWCVARDTGGRVVFVRHALPGERVLARVTESTAKFARAEVTQVLSAVPDRVDPPCPHARPGGCGGCDWQHASPQAQRALKAAVVSQQLRRIAGIDADVTVESLPGGTGGLGWRTRVRFSVGPDGTAGLLRHRSHEVVDVGTCPIAHPLVQAAGITRHHWEGISAVEVVVSPGTGERAVILTPAPAGRGQPAAAARAAALARPADTVLADTVLAAGRGGRLATLSGRGSVRQRAAGRTWRVSAGVFWQVHPAAAGELTAAVLDALHPRPGDAVLDLYCGVGLFAGALAAAVGPGGSVTGVESDRAAVRDARHNLRSFGWARVHAGEVAKVLARGGWPPPALAVLDPPRAGAGRDVIDRLLAGAGASLRAVAYVSCDPATLARDLAVFAGHGWKLGTLRAFDAFPMTHHVECVAALTRV